MAADTPPSFRSALERLKNAGAVNGLLLGWRRQVLINALPFEGFRAERLLHEALDAHSHFASGGDRDIKTLWFGYDTVHVLVVFRGELTLALLHTRAEEVDFLHHAVTTCLEDSQLLIEDLLNPPSGGEGGGGADAGELPQESTPGTNFLGAVA
ncbi:MAG TPA: hypothetical protein VD994_08740 [Prosthecobacter sp.]|nr:hypothetical protein [Prosthecobacter sp.]